MVDHNVEHVRVWMEFDHVPLSQEVRRDCHEFGWHCRDCHVMDGLLLLAVPLLYSSFWGLSTGQIWGAIMKRGKMRGKFERVRKVQLGGRGQVRTSSHSVEQVSKSSHTNKLEQVRTSSNIGQAVVSKNMLKTHEFVLSIC